LANAPAARRDVAVGRYQRSIIVQIVSAVLDPAHDLNGDTLFVPPDECRLLES
jgi:hypothetical protein